MVPLTRTRRLTRDEDDHSDKDAQKENIDSEKKVQDDSDTLKYKQEQTRLCLNFNYVALRCRDCG